MKSNLDTVTIGQPEWLINEHCSRSPLFSQYINTVWGKTM